MSLVSATFKQLGLNGKKALVPYITAGDPTPQLTVPLMHELVAAGADMLELGVPFSDPMADGPAIQRAGQRALKHGVGLRQVLEMVRQFRETNRQTPVILMGYANPIEAMGYAEFSQAASQSKVDGVITVDCPPEECPTFLNELAANNIDPIFLVSPTTTAARLAHIARMGKGFIYYVSLKGVTGAKNLDLSAVQMNIAKIRAQTALPISVGFGIRDPQTAAAISRIADGIVIGSRIVEEIEKYQSKEALAKVSELLKSIREAIDQTHAVKVF